MIRTIDFNNLTAGDSVTDQYSDLGVRIVAAATPPGANQSMIFDTNNPTGEDDDLATDNLDNVLIISEDGDAADPDDNATGGLFNFEFDDAVAIKSLTFLDTEAPALLRFFDVNGLLISEQFVPPAGDNGQSVIQLFVPGTARFEVELQGLGAIDNLVFEDNTVVDPDTLDGIVSGDDTANSIDLGYTGDPDGDRIDAGDAILAGEAADDDIVDALGGNDTVLAGEGDDDVSGGEGDDTIDGGDGNDVADGGEGDDVIDTSGNSPLPDIGYPGVFPADPNPDDDRDSVDGGDGNDTISTGDDADTINGGAGDDVINSGIDDDEVDGGEGDDRIVGAEGNDTIYANNDPVLGLDALELEDDGSNPLGPDLAPDNGDDFVDGGAGDDVIFSGDDNDTLLGGSGDDLLDGGIDDDTLEGNTGNDALIGGQGDDSLEGGQGEDSLEGGIGDDTLRGNNDYESLHGGAGDDLLDGGQGNDVLSGDEGDDTLEGALGDDTLNGGEGDDVFLGGSGDDLFEGGPGNDTMTGGADRDVFQNVNAGDVVDGSETGDDFDCLDLRGSAPEGGSLEVTFDPENSKNGVVGYFKANGSDAGQLVFTNIEKVICFTPGTLIATPKGERKVEELQVGDRVITRDNGMQEIRWVGRREMSGEELVEKEHLRPILIREGALGKGLPERDMMVSPQHRVLIANDKTALYFEEREVLVAAKHLTDMEGIDQVDVSHTSYIHIMFEAHEVILSDGIWTESFQSGDQSLVGIGDAAREEILELFPELATLEGIKAYAAARKSLKKFEAKLLTKKT